MGPLAQRLERFPSLVADLPQHVDPYSLHERLADGDVVVSQVGDHLSRPDTPLLVEATGPVVAERSLYRVGDAGLSGTLGIPLR